MDEATHKKNFNLIHYKHAYRKNLADIRKSPGIKAKLEMFLLPDETDQPRDQHFVLTFGEPVPHETFEKRHTTQEWARLVKDHVYIITGDPYREFSYNKI